MLKFIPLFLFTSCTINHSNFSLKKAERNWAKIYEQELKIARDNNDVEAWLFFWPEYLKEISK